MPSPFLKTLSKSDFKVASTCAKNLKYKKLGYPSNLEENEFLKMLAEGGYIIGKLATLIYPGVEIKGNTAKALEHTRQLLQEDSVTLHEAAIEAGQLLVRKYIQIEGLNKWFRIVLVGFAKLRLNLFSNPKLI